MGNPDWSHRITDEEFKLLESYSRGDVDKLKRWVVRRLYGDPLPYVLGEIEIMDRKFKLDRRAFVPDPLTPQMVRGIIEDTTIEGPTIVDVGTGCGWIAISLALEIKNSKVYGVDIDAGALALAHENAVQHNVEVTFLESFYIDALELEGVEIIVANLPYGSQPDQSLLLESAHPHAQMPAISLYPPEGPFHAMIELFKAIERKGWSPTVFLETGSSRKDDILACVPLKADSEFVQLGKYSYVKVSYGS